MAELLFDQPAEIEEPVTQGNAVFAQSAAALGSQLSDQVDPTVVGPYLERCDNSVLGRVSLELSDGMLILGTGEMRSRLRSQLDEHARVIAYVATDSPLGRLPLALREDERGTPILEVPNPAGGNEYIVMVKVKATPNLASPSL